MCWEPGGHFTKHLKPKIFVSSKMYGTYENLKLKMLSETGTRPLAEKSCLLILGHLKLINFPFGTNGMLIVLGVPILKHFRV